MGCLPFPCTLGRSLENRETGSLAENTAAVGVTLRLNIPVEKAEYRVKGELKFD